MITVGMNYEVLAGKNNAFERKFALVIEVMREMPGHAKTQLFRQVDNDRRYLIVSEWSDEAAFRSFVGSQAFAKVTAWGRDAILAGRPSHEVYGAGRETDGRCPVGAHA